MTNSKFLCRRVIPKFIETHPAMTEKEKERESERERKRERKEIMFIICRIGVIQAVYKYKQAAGVSFPFLI